MLNTLSKYWELIKVLAMRRTFRLYDRTSLRFLWLPLNFLMTIVLIGTVFGILFNDPNFISYFVISFAAWRAFTGIVTNASFLWVTHEHYIRETAVPHEVYLVSWGMSEVFQALNFLVISLLFFTVWEMKLPGSFLLFMLGSLISFTGVFAFALIWSYLCTRYRDLSSITPSLILMAYLITPILWKTESLGQHQYIAQWNPLYHFVEIIREPVFTGTMPWISFMVAFVISAFLLLLAVMGWRQYQWRVVFWL